jgi:hypothetical protein
VSTPLLPFAFGVKGLGGVFNNVCNVFAAMRSVSAGLRSSSDFLGVFVMSNPWERPPFPKRGDRKPQHTFEGVGHMLSRWEVLESEMSMLHAAFLNGTDHFDGIEVYGTGRKIFRERTIGLRSAACCAFVRSPHQELEGDFKRAVEVAELYSDRRNEVAHGCMLRIDVITLFKEQHLDPWLGDMPQWALVSPLYDMRKRANGYTDFCYTRNTLYKMGHCIYEHAGVIADVRTRYMKANGIASEVL